GGTWLGSSIPEPIVSPVAVVSVSLLIAVGPLLVVADPLYGTGGNVDASASIVGAVAGAAARALAAAIGAALIDADVLALDKEASANFIGVAAAGAIDAATESAAALVTGRIGAIAVAGIVGATGPLPAS